MDFNELLAFVALTLAGMNVDPVDQFVEDTLAEGLHIHVAADGSQEAFGVRDQGLLRAHLRLQLNDAFLGRTEHDLCVRFYRGGRLRIR